MTIKKSFLLRAVSLVVAFALTFITVMIFPADVFADSEDDPETIATEITGEIDTDTDGNTDASDDGEQDGTGMPDDDSVQPEDGGQDETGAPDDTAQSEDGGQDETGMPDDAVQDSEGEQDESDSPVAPVPGDETGNDNTEADTILDSDPEQIADAVPLPPDSIRLMILDPETNQWRDITENDKVDNYSQLRVRYDWTVLNKNFYDGFQFYYDLSFSPNLKNMLENTSGKITYERYPVGEYKIEGGRLTITLEDVQRLEQNNATLFVEFYVQLNEKKDENDPDNTKRDVQVGDKDFTLDVVFPDGDLIVNKSASDAYVNDDGDILVDYTVTLNATNGTVHNIKFEDKFGDYLKENGKAKIVKSKCSSGTLTQTDNGFTYIASGPLKSGESIEITYTVKISKDVLSDTSYWNGAEKGKNTITGSYTLTEDTDDEKPIDSSAGFNINKPSVSKGGELIEDDIIEWTIYVDLGVFSNWYKNHSNKGFTLNDLLGTNLENIIDGYGTTQGKNKTYTQDDFEETGDGRYKLTVRTTISDDFKSATTGTQAVNNATLTFDGNDYKATGTVSKAPADIIEKKFVKEEDGKMLWSIEIDAIEGLKDVRITDVPFTNWGDYPHRLAKNKSITVKVDGTPVSITGADMTVTYNEVMEWGIPENRDFTIQLSDSFVQRYWGHKITIEFYTEPITGIEKKDGGFYLNNLDFDRYNASELFPPFRYGNKATIKAKINEDNISVSDSDIYENDNSDSIVGKYKYPLTDQNKDAAVVYTDDGIGWQIKLDVPLSDLKAGDEFVLTDTLPDGMELDETSIRFELRPSDRGEYYDVKNDNDFTQENLPRIANTITAPVVTSGDKPGVKKITITISQQFVETWKDFPNHGGWGLDDYRIFVVYTTTLTEAAKNKLLDTLVETGSGEKFTNNVKLTYKNKTSFDSADQVVKGGLLDKGFIYNSSNADNVKYGSSGNRVNVKYELKVNESGFMIGNGATIEVKDEMGKDLTIIMDSIEITDSTGTRKITDAKYFVDFENNIITFTLPNGTPAKITYWAIIEAPYGSSLSESAQNKLYIDNEAKINVSGTDYTPGSKRVTSSNGSVIQANAGAEAGDYSAVLFKYTNDDGKSTPLTGARFKISAYAEKNGELVEIQPGEPNYYTYTDNLSGLTENGVYSFESQCFRVISTLIFDIFYRVEEVQTPGADYPAIEPFYFVKPGNDGSQANGDNQVVLPNADGDIYVIKESGDYLYVENTKNLSTQKISITVNKEWENDQHTTIDPPANASVKVQLYKNNNAYGTAITLPVDLDGEKVWSYTWNNLDSNATYRVEEVESSPNGCTATYDPAGGTIRPNSTTTAYTVKITNTYTAPKKDIKIKVTKNWQTAAGVNYPTTIPADGTTVTVQLYKDGSALDGYTATLSGNDWTHTWTDLDEGTYEVKEDPIPVGYTSQVTPNPLTINGNGEYTVNITNTQKTADIEISKKDLGGNPVKDAVITLKDANTNATIGTPWTSTSDGSVKTFKLGDGEYILEETTAPIGYKKITSTISFTVRDGKVTEQSAVTTGEYTVNANGKITIKDSPITFKIKKTDIAGKELAGAQLELYSVLADGTENKITNWESTTAAKEIDLSALLNENNSYRDNNGKYRFVLKETSAPDGYKKLITEFTFTVDSNGVVRKTGESAYVEVNNDDDNYIITVQNEAVTAGFVKKFVKDDGTTPVNPVKEDREKIVFELWNETETQRLTYLDLVIKSNVTNPEVGKYVAVFDYPLKDGTYILKEKSSSDDYEPENEKLQYKCIVSDDGENVTFYKTVDGETYAQVNADEVIFTNIQKAGVISPFDVNISKIDASPNSTPVPGATIEIYHADDDWNKGNLADTWISGSESSGVVSLKPGKYIFEETVAPKGYGKVETVVKLTVNNDGSVTPHETYTTGEVYEAYVDGNSVVVFRDAPIEDIELIKTYTDTDLENMDPEKRTALLNETKFTLTDVTATPHTLVDTKSPAWVEGTNGNNGKAVVKFKGKDLIAGHTYELEELKSSNGYVKSKAKYTCVIDEHDGTVKYYKDGSEEPLATDEFPAFENKKIIIKATKKFENPEGGSVNKQPNTTELAGMQFVLLDSEQNVVAEATVTKGSNGGYEIVIDRDKVLSDQTLSAGTYYLKEIYCPSDYTIKNEGLMYECTVDDNGNVSYKKVGGGVEAPAFVNIKNNDVEDTVIEDIKLIKTYEDDNLANMADNDERNAWLSETKFTLTDVTDIDNKEIVDEPRSPEWDDTLNKAVVTFDGEFLQTGHTYHLQETKPRDGYIASDKIFICEIDDNGTVTYSVDGGTESGDFITIDGVEFPACNNVKVKSITIIITKKWLNHDGTNMAAAEIPVSSIKAEVWYDGTFIEEIPIDSTTLQSSIKYLTSDKRFGGIKAFDVLQFEVIEKTGLSGFEAPAVALDETNNTFTITNQAKKSTEPEISLIKTFKTNGVTDANPQAVSKFALYADYKDGKLSGQIGTSKPAEWDNDRNKMVVTFTAKDGVEPGNTYYLQEDSVSGDYEVSKNIYVCKVYDNGKVEYKLSTDSDTAFSIVFPDCENTKTVTSSGGTVTPGGDGPTTTPGTDYPNNPGDTEEPDSNKKPDSNGSTDGGDSNNTGNPGGGSDNPGSSGGHDTSRPTGSSPSVKPNGNSSDSEYDMITEEAILEDVSSASTIYALSDVLGGNRFKTAMIISILVTVIVAILESIIIRIWKKRALKI